MINISKKEVLIVDDERFIRQSFVDYFEDNLWKTLQAESGEKALELLENNSPDGAIVDIRMSGIDGNTFIREACRKKSGMVFVICTGSPVYNIPDDILKRICVSNIIFRKPIMDMFELEKELNRLMDMVNKNLQV